MKNKDIIFKFLTENNGCYCDDCLSEICKITPRQQVYQICKTLNSKERINREMGKCNKCGKQKIVNYITSSNNYSKIKKNPENLNINKSKVSTINNSNCICRKTNEFNKIDIIFEKFDIEDTFTAYSTHTLKGILIKDKYSKLKDKCYSEYEEFMDLKLGEFLKKLKEDNQLFYKEFLNKYGDELYCKFKIQKSSFDKLKGLYMYKCDGQIKYIGRAKGNDNFYKRINAGYANISPKNCYIDGQATNCHVNSLINKVRSNIEFYVMPLDSDDEICSLEKKYINEYKPEWNIALK